MMLNIYLSPYLCIEDFTDVRHLQQAIALGPVVRRPISANLGLNFNLEFFVFCLKAFSQIIFSILCWASNHQIVAQKKKMNFLFKLSYLN